MIFVLKTIGIVLGFAFPVFLIKAVRLNDTKYIALSSLSFGVLVFIIICFLPNS